MGQIEPQRAIIRAIRERAALLATLFAFPARPSAFLATLFAFKRHAGCAAQCG